MINNVFVKEKSKRGKSYIDKHDNLQVVMGHDRFFGKGEPVGIINDPHKWTIFTIGMTRDGAQSSPGQFLDENDIETGM